MGNPNLVGDVYGRLIAFDLDGTVIDSRRDLTDSANQLIAELGGTSLSEEAVGFMVGEGARLLVSRALEAAGLGDRPGALERFLEIYDTRLLYHTKPYAGILEALRAARSHARVAILTNKPTRSTDRLLDALDLRSLVDDVVGGDGTYPRKPDPSSLRALMQGAGAQPARTLLVGDSAVDQETARRAATRYCLAGYGFGRVTVQPERLSGDEWSVEHAGKLPAVFDAFMAAAR